MKTIQPLPPDPSKSNDPAVNLIRDKVARAYAHEPEATEEMEQVAKERVLSKHQLYMQELTASGKSLAEIQTAWHHYYTKLSNVEKHEVWQEFYAANTHTPYQKLFQKGTTLPEKTPAGHEEPPTNSGVLLPAPTATVVVSEVAYQTSHERSTTSERAKKAIGKKAGNTKLGKKVSNSEATQRLSRQIKDKVSAGGKLETKHHIQSLLFGLGMGTIVLLVLLFSFFNEFIIAPFIQPSRKATAAPVIVSNVSTTAAAQPTIIIPKINIQIPVDFTTTSTTEAVIQESLEEGIVHYPNTAFPGQNGNGAYFGHSSSNIFNNGKYKFAFVLLHQLTTGDVFYITHQGKVYAYQVFAKEIVPPTKVSVLNDTKGKQATAALITCDPPGLSTNRLVVWGEQISPSPATNTAPTPRTDEAPTEISSNGPTLWTRMIRGLQFWKQVE
jgi:LPXTG-site transpeptidase (sortase) family protein